MSPSKLFTPLTLSSSVSLPHRVVLAPCTRFRSDPDSQIPDPSLSPIYYEQRASCSGLLITEATAISDLAARYPGTPGIYSEEQIQVWSEVTKRVHAKSGRIFLQLWHVGRAIHSSLIRGNQPVSSSPVPQDDSAPVRGQYTDACGGRKKPEIPRPLSKDDIKDVVKDYVRAARNAVEKAGFDGVELHAANGYLVDQFLRDGVNKREDDYGGSFENRSRFLFEILDAICEFIDPSRVAVRFSPWGTFNSMSDSDPLSLYTWVLQEMSRRIPKLAYIHVTDFDPKGSEEITLSVLETMSKLRSCWAGTFILNINRISREKAISLVESQVADAIAIGRDFIANPDLPKRWMENLELNQQRPEYFYTSGAEGYTDYPFHTKRDGNGDILARRNNKLIMEKFKEFS